MDIKHKPATRLPWALYPHVESPDDLAYIEHAANAYPRLVEALKRFAAMDRAGCDPNEIAVSRGVASDMTILTSGDFTSAAALLRELGEL